MKEHAVNVAIVKGKTIDMAVELGGSQGVPAWIKAVEGDKYILGQAERGVAPENLIVKRVGRDLHLSLEGVDANQSQLIIEGYYDHPGQLVGVAEDGSYHEYVALDAEQERETAFLLEGVSSPLVLGAGSLPGFGDGLVAGTGAYWFWPALLGASALGLVGAYAATSGSDNKSRGADYGSGNEVNPPDAPSMPHLPNKPGHGEGQGGIELITAGGALITSGDSTNVVRPVLGGSGLEPGDTVIIRDNGNELDRVVVAPDGNWTFIPGSDLAEGDHDFTILIEDAAGNQSPESDPFPITVDTLAPAAPVITEVLDNTGTSIADGADTNELTPVLRGRAEPGSTVHVSNGVTLLGSVTADLAGDWSFAAGNLAPAGYEFTAVAEDATGNRSNPSNSISIFVSRTTTWSFDDDTLQGWTPHGGYSGGTINELIVTGGRVQSGTNHRSVDYSGAVISISIDVIAGETYDFGFDAASRNGAPTFALLGLAIDGTPIGSPLELSSTTAQKITGIYLATATGSVTLSIINATATGTGNDFWLENITMQPRAPVPLSQAVITEDSVASSQTTNLEILNTSDQSVQTDAGFSEILGSSEVMDAQA